MSLIVPTFTTTDPENYKERMVLYHDFAKRIHVDVTDGEMAPLLLPLTQIWWPEEFVVDVHMMTKKPSVFVENLVKLKPQLVIFHAESDEDLRPIMDDLKKRKIKAGLAFLKNTYPGDFAEYVNLADHVMIFDGVLGKHGGHPSLMQIEKARLVRKINQTVEIGWDGGANMSNVFAITKGGVDVINVGSALAETNDPAQMYEALEKEANRNGAI